MYSEEVSATTRGTSSHHHLNQQQQQQSNTSSSLQHQLMNSAVVVMVGDEEYESLPDEYPLLIHMTAGSIAGIVEHAAIYPIDCVKTQLQSVRSVPYSGVLDAFTTIQREKGMRRMFRGMSAMVLGAGPAHAMYFGCYENVKSVLTTKMNGNSRNSDLANGLAGACATLFHDVVMTPAEVVKQRMQMYSSNYTSCQSCIAHVYRSEGPRAFYRSFTTSYLMNAPFQAIHFIAYEKAQVKLNPDRTYNPSTHMLSGALAGGAAAFITNPLDVCKTLLNTQQHDNNSVVRGLPNALRTVYAKDGVRTFFRGVLARVLYQAPSTAISWSVYELFKRQILKTDNRLLPATTTTTNLLPTTTSRSKSKQQT